MSTSDAPSTGLDALAARWQEMLSRRWSVYLKELLPRLFGDSTAPTRQAALAVEALGTAIGAWAQEPARRRRRRRSQPVSSRLAGASGPAPVEALMGPLLAECFADHLREIHLELAGHPLIAAIAVPLQIRAVRKATMLAFGATVPADALAATFDLALGDNLPGGLPWTNQPREDLRGRPSRL